MYQELNEKLKVLAGGSFVEEDKVMPAVAILKREGFLLMQDGDDPTHRFRLRENDSRLGIECGLSTPERINQDGMDVDLCELNIAWSNKTDQVTEVFLSEL
jgi:hypothetical protein